MRSDVVGPVDETAPTVAADAGAVGVGSRLQVGEIRVGVVRREDHRRSDFDKRSDSEAEAKAVGVGEGEAEPVIVAGQDMSVDVSMPVAPFQGVAEDGRALEAVVEHATRSGSIAADIEAGVIG